MYWKLRGKGLTFVSQIDRDRERESSNEFAAIVKGMCDVDKGANIATGKY